VHLPRYFIIYNLGIDSIEEEDCPYWNVWGPTLEKYGITRSQEMQK
jgi:hypothetical protein